MVNTLNVIVVAGITILCLLGWLTYLLIAPSRNKFKQDSKLLHQRAIVIDFLHGFEARVNKKHRRGVKEILEFDNGYTIPYDENLFHLLNPTEVLIGNPARFVYGISDEQIQTKKYAEVIQNLKVQQTVIKARKNEERVREQNFTKDIVKKSRDNVRRRGEDGYD